ncbi:MAG: ABC transporter ATP-binding protein [Vulcanimicrobiaceae bacterium]
MEALIQVQNVTKVHGAGGDAVHALNNVSFSQGEHEFVCVVGPSGCGKTTLLNLIAGFEQPTSGLVAFDGAPIAGPDARRAVVFQEHALFPWLTVKGNVQYGPKRRGIRGPELAAITERYVNLAGLTGFERKYPHQLSGGMRQRLGIVRALANSPEMLLMDEPFGSLDSLTRERMQDDLVLIWGDERKAIFFITHSIEEALKLGDRVIVMSSRPGRIIREFRLTQARPRHADDAEVAELAKEIRRLLFDGSAV